MRGVGLTGFCSWFSLDHLVGAQQKLPRNREAERFGRLEVDYQVECCRLFYRQIARLCPLEDLVDVACRTTELNGGINAVRHETPSRDEVTVCVNRRQAVPGS